MSETGGPRHGRGPGDEPPGWERAAARGHGSLRRSFALTFLSTILPGAGLLGASPRWAKILGAITSLVFIGTIAYLGWSASSDLGAFAGFAVDPAGLRAISGFLVVIGLIWVALIVLTHILTRPRRMTSSAKLTGAVLVTVLSLVIAAPIAVASRYSMDHRNLVVTIFQAGDDVKSSTRPTIDAKEDNPWKDHPRLNVLLLGGDGGSGRDEALGVRTDTQMIASIDTATGDTLLIQVPRNVQYTPFPEGSEMAELFPNGFTGPGNEEQWFVNVIWEFFELGEYPELFVGETYRGAEALKQGMEGITGLKIDYFALLDIDGIQDLIDAMGGVTVNINQRLNIGGDTKGRRPSGYLEPGPNQHLDGYHAMWYARSRSNTDDYNRMARQSCLVDAIIRQANPITLLTSYEAIAEASSRMVVTDIPQEALQPLVELAFKVKDADVERLVFTPGKNGYSYNNPDFEQMRAAVQEAISPSKPGTQTPTSAPSPDPTASPELSPSPSPTFIDGAQNVTDACAYNPES